MVVLEYEFRYNRKETKKLLNMEYVLCRMEERR